MMGMNLVLGADGAVDRTAIVVAAQAFVRSLLKVPGSSLDVAVKPLWAVDTRQFVEAAVLVPVDFWCPMVAATHV